MGGSQLKFPIQSYIFERIPNKIWDKVQVMKCDFMFGLSMKPDLFSNPSPLRDLILILIKVTE